MEFEDLPHSLMPAPPIVGLQLLKQRIAETTVGQVHLVAIFGAMFFDDLFIHQQIEGVHQALFG